MQQTASLFRKAHSDPNVRVIVLSARGKCFSAGLDRTPYHKSLLTPEVKDVETTSLYVSGGSNTDPARTATVYRSNVRKAQECTDAIAACTKPLHFLLWSQFDRRVLCVLHGVSVGIAIDISSACDIRLASQDSKLSIKEVDIGVAADLGTLQRFPRLVGNDSWVRELALSGRFFSAKEALEKGFVSSVCESKENAVSKAMEIAKVMVGKSPVAVQGTKALLDYSRDHPIREGWSQCSLTDDRVGVYSIVEFNLLANAGIRHTYKLLIGFRMWKKRLVRFSRNVNHSSQNCRLVSKWYAGDFLQGFVYIANSLYQSIRQGVATHDP